MNRSAVNARLGTARCLLALSIAGAWPGLAASGQDPDWVTVDEFQLEDLSGNRLISHPEVVFVDSRGNAFVGGICWMSGAIHTQHAVVRRSPDGGQTWTTVLDLFSFDSRHWVEGFAEDARGNTYLLESIVKGTGDTTSILWRSTDGGEIWGSVDEVDGVDIGYCAIATDSSGTILFMTGGGGVRRSLDAGSTWEWVDGAPGGAFRGSSIASTVGAVFVSGDQCPPGGCRIPEDAIWLLKKTSDGGDTWTTVYESSTDDRSQKLLLDSRGTLHAMGALCGGRVGEEALQCNGTRLRKAVRDGADWEEVFSDQAICVVEDMAFDPRGALYAAGCSKYGDRSGLQEGGAWQTRKSTDGGKSWELSDRFVAPENPSENWATAVAVDREGSVYVCGPQQTGPPTARSVWFVRKLPDPNQARFRRGDADGSGEVDIRDALFALNGLFLGGPQPACPDASDADDDGGLSLSDAVYSLGYLFRAGPRPPDPGPEACGVDPSADDLEACEYERSRC